MSEIKTMAIRQQTLERMASICRDTFLSKIMAGAGYGATAYIYQESSISDMELSSPQCILLALLYSLVTEDVMSCCLIADVCHHLQQLQSDYLRVWLTGDFQFPHQDMEKAMALFTKLLEADVLKLPSHVTRIMSSLAAKYRISGTHLISPSVEERGNLATRLEEAVVKNSPGDIIAVACEGGDVNGSTQSGDKLIHLAVRLGNCSSVAALGFLKANLEAMNSINVTPLEEAVKKDSESLVKALLSYGAEFDKHLIRGDTYLHIAASGSHNNAMKALIKGGMDVNKKNLLDETPIFRAVGAGNVHGVEMLLEEGADAGLFPDGSKSLLEIAAVSQNVAMFKALVKGSANLKFKDGQTIFHVVAQFGNIEMLKVIYEMNLPAINVQDNEGSSALMIALKYCKEDVATFLLHNGADPKMKDNIGRTPLHYAAEGGCVGLVTTLLVAGAKVNDKDKYGETPAFVSAVNKKPAVLRLLVENGADLALTDRYYDGILHHEARSGHVEVVRVLLDNGATVNMQGQKQKTALHLAAERGHTVVVDTLLDAGVVVDMKDDGQRTALHWGAEGGHTAVVRALLDAGATVDMKTNSQWTALHFAAWKGHTAVVTTLLNAGAEVDLKNYNQSTALHLATEEEHIDVVKVLLSAGPAVDLKNQNQKTVLHLAAEKGHTELVTALLDAGAAVDLKDNMQSTALCLAAGRGHTSVVSVLLDRGADPAGKGGWPTPLTAASSGGHLAVVKLLVDHSAPINDNKNKSSALYYAIQNKRWSLADYLRSKGAHE